MTFSESQELYPPLFIKWVGLICRQSIFTEAIETSIINKRLNKNYLDNRLQPQYIVANWKMDTIYRIS